LKNTIIMIIDRYVSFKYVFQYFYEERTRSNKNALFEVPELHKYIKYWLENGKNDVLRVLINLFIN